MSVLEEFNECHRDKITIYANKYKAMKDYIALLENELKEIVPIAHTHGWRSTRHKEGERLRKIINSQ